MVRDYDRDAIPSVYNLQDAPAAREGPGFRQVVFRGIDQLIGFTEIGPEREASPPHDHPFEQMNMLLDGELDFLVDGERVSLERYDAVTIPPEVEHASRAVSEETATLLAVWPLREDRVDATDYQREFPTANPDA
ncbi:cupin domain-containing protein [Halopenitus persicus]|uniref:Cupin domain protein n=1 Tax=Halopenitus persicus TaxID=1048396 RepID=A0A1H3H7E0_9EURY|nr:cupin domain-containing protein [Halopenitus persicus]SDY11371.1 Cupin domain protein [Halopenitus persicus]